jgi:transcriptional regulator with XRE-family HTH domain
VNATAGNGTSLTRAARARQREAVAAERQVDAFRLRADLGLTFEEIALRLGVSRATAWKSFQRQLAAARREVDPDDAQEHVQVQLRRLDRAVAAALAIIDDQSETADVRMRGVDRLLRAEERRSRLLGLDRPARTEVGVRPLAPREDLSPEQVEQELEAFGMEAAISIHRGPEYVRAPDDA